MMTIRNGNASVPVRTDENEAAAPPLIDMAQISSLYRTMFELQMQKLQMRMMMRMVKDVFTDDDSSGF